MTHSFCFDKNLSSLEGRIEVRYQEEFIGMIYTYIDTLLYLGVTLEITLFRLITSCLKCKVCTLSDIEIKKFIRIS